MEPGPVEDLVLDVHRETLEIAGGRKLYNYTFSVDGTLLAPMKPEDVQNVPPERAADG